MAQITNDLILKTRLQITKTNLERIFKLRMASTHAGQPDAIDQPGLYDDIRRDLRKLKDHLSGLEAALGELETLQSNSSRCLRSENRQKAGRVSDNVAQANGHLEGAGKKLAEFNDTLIAAMEIVNSMDDRCVKIGSGHAQTAADSLADEAENCIKAIDKISTDHANSDGLGFKDARAAWSAYAEEVYERSHSVFREYVDFLGGLAMRDTGMDEGICELAEELLKGLRVYDGYALALPARHEAVTKILSRVIRLGFPEWTIWALPLTAHELGHVIVESDKDIRSHVEAIMQRDTVTRPQLEAILADAIATLITGPAYACATVLLRFDPLGEDAPTGYPADSKRAVVIFSILKWMSQQDSPIGVFGDVINRLEAQWNSAMKDAGATQVSDQVKRQIEAWIEPLKDRLLPGARAQSTYLRINWGNVTVLSNKLASETEEFDTTGGLSMQKNGILNAAWIARLEFVESHGLIAKRTKALFERKETEAYASGSYSGGKLRPPRSARLPGNQG